MKNLEDFKAKYPDIYSAIFEVGKKAGIAEGIKQGEIAGIIQEKKDAKKKSMEVKKEQEALDNLSIEDKAELAWSSNPSLKDEFRVFDTYLAYVKGVADGRVKICGRTT